MFLRKSYSGNPKRIPECLISDSQSGEFPGIKEVTSDQVKYYLTSGYKYARVLILAKYLKEVMHVTAYAAYDMHATALLVHSISLQNS